MTARARVLAVAVLLALGVWWFLGGDDAGVPEAPAPAPNNEAAAPVPAPVLAPPKRGSAPPEPMPEPEVPPTPEPEKEDAARLLVGRVLAATSGKPVVGAVVHVRDPAPGPLKLRLITDAEGRFEAATLAPALEVLVLGGGWVTDRVSDKSTDGYNPLFVELAAGGKTQHEIRAVRCGRVHGLVLDTSGRPAAGAIIKAEAMRRSYDALWWVRELVPVINETKADAQGRYRLGNLVPDVEHRIEAQAGEQSPAWSDPFTPEPGVDVEVNVALPLTRWAKLKVIEATSGEPVPGVEFVLRQTTPTEKSLSFEETSDPEGALSLGPLAAGPFELEMRKTGAWIATKPIPSGDATKGTGDIEFTVEVQRGLPIAGRVLGPDGEPAGPMYVDAAQAHWELEIQADKEGRFRFPAVPKGKAKLRVLTDSWGEMLVEKEVEAGDEDVVLQLTEPAMPALVVHVLDPAGKPIPMVAYAATVENGGGMSTDRSDTPLELQPSLEARWIGISSPRDENGELLPYAPAHMGPVAPETKEITIRLRPGVGISGRVIDPAGAPVRGVEISARPARPPDGARFMGMQASAVTSADGRFHLVGLREDTEMALYAGAGDSYAPIPRLRVMSGTKDFVIRLEHSVRAVLTVLSPKGRRVSRAWVQVSRSENSGGLAHGRTDREGRFVLRGLSPRGRYSLEVRPGEGWPLIREIGIEDWSIAQHTVRLRPAFRIKGQVVDPQGRPAPAAHVVSMDAEGKANQSKCDARGWFEAGQLAGGPASLRATATVDGKRLMSPTLRIEAGASDARLVLAETTTLAVTIRGWTYTKRRIIARLVPGQRPGNQPWARIDSAGRVRFDFVNPSATYGLYVLHGKDKDPRVAWSGAIRGDAGSVELVLKPPHEIRGKVLLSPGMERGRVWIRERGVDVATSVKEDGSFVLPHMPEGTFTIHIAATDARGRRTTTVQASTDREVEVRLR